MRTYVELSKNVGSQGEVVHWCVLSTWHNSWHIVCAQLIFIGWVTRLFQLWALSLVAHLTCLLPRASYITFTKCSTSLVPLEHSKPKPV